MSSVTFLASAVLTVCILHAVDQNMENAVQKIENNFHEKAEVNHADTIKFQQIIKPVEAKALTPNAQVFSVKKVENFAPSSASEKHVVAKANSAI